MASGSRGRDGGWEMRAEDARGCEVLRAFGPQDDNPRQTLDLLRGTDHERSAAGGLREGMDAEGGGVFTVDGGSFPFAPLRVRMRVALLKIEEAA
ncbi:MAG: hypothetical protein RL177_689 [Bacteroidota bacterium]